MIDERTLSQLTFVFYYIIYGNLIDNLIGRVYKLNCWITLLSGISFILIGLEKIYDYDGHVINENLVYAVSAGVVMIC